MKNAKTIRHIITAVSVILILSSLFALAGCGKTEPKDPVVKLFDDYAAAISAEDIDAYMDCIDRGSGEINIDTIKASMKNVFERYDIDAKITDISITNRTDTSALATVTIEYINTGDNVYIDNRVTGEYKLSFKNDKWVITSSIMKSVTYLDGTVVSKSDATYIEPDENSVPVSDADILSPSDK